MSIAPQRERTYTLFVNACEKGAAQLLWLTCDDDWKITMVRRMERSCMNAVLEECEHSGIDRRFTDQKFIARYSAAAMKVADALERSEYLLASLIDETIDCNDVGKLSSMELCPDASAKERAEIAERKRQKTANKVSRAHVCRVCGGDKTIKIEQQSRAVDELSTWSIKCTDCGNVWRA